MKEYTVREVAEKFKKHEETIKRWVRSGKFPNAYIKSDKEGWRIPEIDLDQRGQVPKNKPFNDNIHTDSSEEIYLISLAYQAVDRSASYALASWLLTTTPKLTLRVVLLNLSCLIQV